jgi:hypothetical protein
MNYICTIKTQRSCPPHHTNLDNYTFSVSAETAEHAISKAIRQSKQDSGFQRTWRCVGLERGGWIVS